MIDIVTAILGTGLLSCLALPKQNTSIEKASVFSDMKIGVKYAFSDRLIRKLLIIYGLFTFFCVPAGYLAGLLVRRVFGDTYWYLTAVEVVGFVGMMVGGVVMSTWGGFKSRGKTLSVGLLAFGSFAIGMGLSQNFILYLGILRSGIDDGANGNYHYAARENRHIYARACLWITRNNVLRLFADWYGYIWPAG